MRRVSIKDCSKEFLEGMAKSLARTIDKGRTHNDEGYPLADLLEQVIAAIPDAPPYHITHGEHGR